MSGMQQIGSRPHPLDTLPRHERRAALAAEAMHRKYGQWGAWETLTFPPGSAGRSWAATFTKVHRNKVFSVLDRDDFSGARHLAVSSLSGIRPSWHEMQRIKDDLAGERATAVEVYPPRSEIIDDADMFHIWVLPGALPFSLYRASERQTP
jgi:hypothetical protein